MGRRLTIEQFLEKAKSIHGEEYDYSLVEYKNNSTKVKIICIKHGVRDKKKDDYCFEKNKKLYRINYKEDIKEKFNDLLKEVYLE